MTAVSEWAGGASTFDPQEILPAAKHTQIQNELNFI